MKALVRTLYGLGFFAALFAPGVIGFFVGYLISRNWDTAPIGIFAPYLGASLILMCWMLGADIQEMVEERRVKRQARRVAHGNK